MNRIALHLVLLTGWFAIAMACGPLRAAGTEGGTDDRNDFVAIALHDVVDSRDQLDEDSVTSDRLVVLLEWLAGNGWTAISLDDIERARTGGPPLPPRSVLITVDDGLSSLYTRVYPLAVAYRMPVVAALVGQWMDVPIGSTVRYGERELPREAFISWQQAREMQASGWVEFASHSDALHTVVHANPQGNLLPAGQNRIRFDDRYETDTEFRARIRADLTRSRERLLAELGREPRAIVWPYGRYNEDSLAIAKDLGFRFAMTLEPGPATTTQPLAIPRFLPTADPELGTWAANLSLHDPWPAARRIVAFDPAQLLGASPAETDSKLGRAIDRLVALGATHAMLDAGTVGNDGTLQSTWFPNAQVPMRADVLGRFAAQIRARTGVDVIVRLPHQAVLRRVGNRQNALDLYRDLAVHVPFEGLVLEDAPSLDSSAATSADTPWQVARRRASVDIAGWPDGDATMIEAFRTAARMRPGLQAYWLAPEGHALDRPAAWTEATLVPRALDSRADDVIALQNARRIGLYLRMPDASAHSTNALARAARAFQIEGGTVIAWGPDDILAPPANAESIAPVVSARRVPLPTARKP